MTESDHALLRHYLVEAINDIRARLAECDVPGFHMEIEADGNVDSGDVRLSFALRERYGDWVRGGSLPAVLTELLRRKGWSERNASICLPRVANTETETA